ncbi:MAG TPA: carboxylating nicotinate-nucleotide diphosphorylase [Myxococcaceae bacterium]|nr:carboxylating nicotinate-nucleotide diphosphorylase [Myxococcaceae bacterium]
MDSLDRLIDLALEEDLAAPGDITTQALRLGGEAGSGELWAKEPMVVAGLEAFARVFHRVDPEVEVAFHLSDGKALKRPFRVATLSGRFASMLRAERVALNIVQRACGIATATRKAVEAIGTSDLKLLDTRKTPPGMRQVAKAAVRAGGGHNHRFGLFDGILIKDNHIAAVGSVKEAIRRARSNAPRLVKIEVEVTNLKELEEAIASGAQICMLDNMSDAEIRKAVEVAGGRVELEVSGGITLERLPKIALLGVDYVSMGAITHSAPSMDLSLELIPGKQRRGSLGRSPGV